MSFKTEADQVYIKYNSIWNKEKVKKKYKIKKREPKNFIDSEVDFDSNYENHWYSFLCASNFDFALNNLKQFKQ